MARDWEKAFREWIARSSDHEQKRSENAERMIRKAIAAYEPLNGYDLRFIPQGSYANNTNVKLSSDVDICVCNMDIILPDYWKSGLDDKAAGLVNTSYTFSDFKNDVEAALVEYFGDEKVLRGNKAIDVHETAYRLDADVLACIEHRRYDWLDRNDYKSGIWFVSDQGAGKANWPEQHQANGTEKNLATGRRFKRVVRIIKRLRNEMAENQVDSAEDISSYLIECLVWNVPNKNLTRDNFYDTVRSVLAFLFNNTINYGDCKDWGEVSELTYLFTKDTRQKRKQVNAFLDAAWDYIGYE